MLVSIAERGGILRGRCGLRGSARGRARDTSPPPDQILSPRAPSPLPAPSQERPAAPPPTVRESQAVLPRPNGLALAGAAWLFKQRLKERTQCGGGGGEPAELPRPSAGAVGAGPRSSPYVSPSGSVAGSVAGSARSAASAGSSGGYGAKSAQRVVSLASCLESSGAAPEPTPLDEAAKMEAKRSELAHDLAYSTDASTDRCR